MRVLDLFAGIGGFSLAAHWMGWETVAFVEKEKFCQKVLAKNFPGVPIYGDIFEFDGKPFRGAVDLVVGGFPCQPFSTAGKRKGRADERAIFPQMLRVVEESQPRWVIAENVRGLLSIESGDVFEEVAASLECIGYEVQAFCVPACAINAPHRRDRIWIVAHTDRFGSGTGLRQVQGTNGKVPERYNDAELGNADLCVASAAQHAERNGCASGDLTGSDEAANGKQPAGTDAAADVAGTGRNAAHAERVRGGAGLREDGTVENRHQPRNGNCSATNGNGKRLQGINEGTHRARQSKAGFGLPDWDESWIKAATRFCRMDDVVPDRIHRLKALGNSVVPALVVEIFKAIEAAENQ